MKAAPQTSRLRLHLPTPFHPVLSPLPAATRRDPEAPPRLMGHTNPRFALRRVSNGNAFCVCVCVCAHERWHLEMSHPRPALWGQTTCGVESPAPAPRRLHLLAASPRSPPARAHTSEKVAFHSLSQTCQRSVCHECKQGWLWEDCVRQVAPLPIPHSPRCGRGTPAGRARRRHMRAPVGGRGGGRDAAVSEGLVTERAEALLTSVALAGCSCP